MSTLGRAWRYKQHTYTQAVWGYLEPTDFNSNGRISNFHSFHSTIWPGSSIAATHVFAVRPPAHTVPQQEWDYAPSKSNFSKLHRRGCLNKENRWTNCLIHALTVFSPLDWGRKSHSRFTFVWMFGSHHSHKLILLERRTLGPLVFRINAAFIG